ncbi:MAG: hypothetical protein OXH04_21575 [Acidobacteria bacterium]|nr:hypothetical protein [Acidobacteriota bacterium]
MAADRQSGSTTAALEAIGERLRAGEGLASGDAAVLAATPDLVALGALADERRRAVRGDRVTFVRVLEVGAAAGGAGPDGVPPRAGEVRVVGRPASIVAAVAAARRLREAAGRTPVTGFALDDLVDVCGADSSAVREALAGLREAGLERVAEARVDGVADPAWIELAAAEGLPVARLTVASADADALETAGTVSAWGAAAAGVRVFAPLPTNAGPRPSTGYDDLRRVALARLVVDNIDSIQVDWRSYGPKLAQVALTFGADDVDAVSPIDTLEHGWRRAPLEEIARNVSAAARVPIERNGRFEIGTARP